jgi:hypothetical protein
MKTKILNELKTVSFAIAFGAFYVTVEPILMSLLK